MSTKRFRLTPTMRAQIIASIRSGGYPHVAAAAWGMPRAAFDDWWARGSAKDAREPYAPFVKEVIEAQAQARLRAEMAVFEAEPKTWLIHGPGREAPTNPGWSVSVKPAEASLTGRNALLDPELMQLFRTLMDVLDPYPEARDKVAQTLLGVGADPSEPEA
jgi:hypothetical protein